MSPANGGGDRPRVDWKDMLKGRVATLRRWCASILRTLAGSLALANRLRSHIGLAVRTAPTGKTEPMSRYVIAVRHYPPTLSLMGAVREVPGIELKGAASPLRVLVEAAPSAAEELRRRFGEALIIEPEVRHKRLMEASFPP